RTPGSIAMRLNNFASVDPYHSQRGIKGLPGGKKQVEPIWHEFINSKEELLFEGERILANLESTSIENKYDRILQGIEGLEGITKLREVKTRVNQYVFREIVLANYGGKCAITGINIPDLLVASHIKPWSKFSEERLNPQNGIAINALHDKAFDNGLMTITPDFKILISARLLKKAVFHNSIDFFRPFHNKTIHLPAKFFPDPAFLKYHNDERFKG
ncbi:MAG: HNH endonuclease, partial [Bacteroidota bacterium]